MLRGQADCKLFIEGANKLNDCHQMVQLDPQLELSEQELEQVDVCDVLYVRLQAHVEGEDGAYVLHCEVVMRHATIDTARLQYDRKQGHLLALVVDLQAIQVREENRLRVRFAIDGFHGEFV